MRNEFLSAHLRDTKQSLADFGSRIGRGKAAVHKYINGRVIPPAAVIALIEKESGGAVPASSWKPIILHRAFGTDPPPSCSADAAE